MAKDTPYISVVIVSRNDDHGSRMFLRTQACVNGMIAQMEKHKIPSELVFVEWLPPFNKPLLKDIFPWPKKTEWCQIRIIVVSPSDIGNCEWSEDYSIRDLTPWNVGIRLAKGDFILSITADILFSDELINFFSQRKLEKNKMYRIDRCNVNKKVMDLGQHDEQLRYCKKNIIDIYAPYPFESFIKGKVLKKKLPFLHNYSPGDFMLFSKERWNLLHGFPEGISPGADNILLYMAYLSGAKEYVFKKPMRLYHIDHKSKWQTPLYMLLRKFFYRTKLPYPFTTILTLLASKLQRSKSYLEVNNFKLLKREEIYYLILDMVQGKRPYIYNDENWGLGGQQFEEFILPLNNKILTKSNSL